LNRKYKHKKRKNSTVSCFTLLNFFYRRLYFKFAISIILILKTVNSISSYHCNNDSIVTIGTFDGLHLGHQKIISKVVQIAEAESLESIVLSFFPHPRMVLQQDNSIKLLNTLKEKEKQLDELGVNHLIIHPFSHDFSQLSAEEFVKTLLVDQLHCKKIVIGHDHRFGKNRTANIDDLILFGKKYHFEVEQISAQEIDEIAVSSTKIRNAITEGNITIANNYLGYAYSFTGKVVQGKQLGRTIGFPTANIVIEQEYKLIPKNGVYIVSINIHSEKYFGMMNIGTRPTVNGEQQTIEVYILHFEKEIYNEIVTVEVLQFIRNEQKFDSLESLKNQIEKDKSYTLSYINNTF
jgi:riboflavin kinase / FMN adenylyltransferase